MDNLSQANVAVLVPEVWAEKQTEAFKAKLEAVKFFADFSDLVVNGGDTIHLPNATAMAAHTKTNGSAITLNQWTETEATLTVNTWTECSVGIEEREVLQLKRSYKLQGNYYTESAYAVAKAYDAAVVACFSSFSNSVGSSTAAIADSNILAALATLGTKDVPLEDCAFFFHPAVFYSQIWALEKFTSDIYVEGKPVETGRVGRLYGIPVFITTQIANVSGTTGRVNFLGHKDAIAHAAFERFVSAVDEYESPEKGMIIVKSTKDVPSKVKTRVDYDPMYKAYIISSDAVYGATKWRDDAGVIIYTKA